VLAATRDADGKPVRIHAVTTLLDSRSASAIQPGPVPTEEYVMNRLSRVDSSHHPISMPPRRDDEPALQATSVTASEDGRGFRKLGSKYRRATRWYSITGATAVSAPYAAVDAPQPSRAWTAPREVAQFNARRAEQHIPAEKRRHQKLESSYCAEPAGMS
jgi:hypothetical protein